MKGRRRSEQEADDWLTMSQVAEMLGITRQSVHGAIEAGRLRATRTGPDGEASRGYACKVMIRRADAVEYEVNRRKQDIGRGER